MANSQIFVVDGTFTVPNGVNEVLVSLCGAGGGGTAIWGQGGGAAECFYRRTVAGLTPGQQIPITIGMPGVQAYNPKSCVLFPPASLFNSYNCNGANGGDTLFGGYLTATGGKGATATVSSYSAGATGGVGGNSGEQPAVAHIAISNGTQTYQLRNGGRGGDSLFGPGGSSGSGAGTSFPVAGGNGVGYGSGGAGGSDNQNYSTSMYYTTDAGVGAQGICIVEW